jgi:hypothetical protein
MHCANTGRGLAFAGIDLKITPDGEIFCLEVNPGLLVLLGQYKHPRVCSGVVDLGLKPCQRRIFLVQ